MRQLLAFVKKEFLHIFRDYRTMMLLLLMPIVQIILFGFALTNEVNNTNTAIYIPKDDILAAKLMHKIDNSKYFTVTHLLKSPKEVEELMRRGEIKLAVIVPEGFSADYENKRSTPVQVISDASDPNMATTVTNYASNIILSFANLSVSVENRMLYNPQMKSSYNFVPGVMGLILMLICAMMTSVAIVREKETGTMEVLLVSPVRPIYLILAKTIPYFILSLINLITILLLSKYVLAVPINGSLFLLSAVSMLFVLVSLSLGLMISTLVETQVAAMLISGMVFMMPVMILSGMMFPVENMPLILKGVAQLIPAKWFIAAVRKVMIQGVGFMYVLKEICVMLLMMSIFIGISVKKFKHRLD